MSCCFSFFCFCFIFVDPLESVCYSTALCPSFWVSLLLYFHPYICKRHIILVAVVIMEISFHWHTLPFHSLSSYVSVMWASLYHLDLFMIQLGFDGSLNTIHSFLEFWVVSFRETFHVLPFLALNDMDWGTKPNVSANHKAAFVLLTTVFRTLSCFFLVVHMTFLYFHTDLYKCL